MKVSITCDNCNMGIRDLPDTYVYLEPEGRGYTYQVNHKCTCYSTAIAIVAN